jgi:oxygen-independent coproporphyrinogen III oxidase
MPTAVIREDMLRRFDVAGPRYTSYPTADRFGPDFGASDYANALRSCRGGSVSAPLSLYAHIPFCASLCYYCACNKIVTKHHERARQYLDYLKLELDRVVEHLGPGRVVSQLHLGGGTPTFLHDDELAEWMDHVRSHFQLKANGEYAVEVDPRTVTPKRLKALREMGINRLSFGVQDFDHDVQVAVHRVQSEDKVFALVAHARELGFESINIDLIYGLPKQTPQTFVRTLERVQTLRPDRIAVYGYAHLPARFKPQRRIDVADMPAGKDKLHMLSSALRMLGDVGYEYIGMDHFALPDDALAVAKRQGRLHRNFQGYTTYPDSDLIAVGVSAIGRVGATYNQNVKTLDAYYAALDAGGLPVERGLALTRDDMIRRAAIAAIMCAGELLFEPFSQAWLIDVRSYFAPEMERLMALADDGLVRVDDHGIAVTAMGWYLVRIVAMVFDRHLQQQREPLRYSRVV